eukprot:TRINITY_DN14245_c0_g1_i1.p1 TRINITY_DN14245_c0_g1~~TRINITY_DN14245_c0_g1_i1.p1  ORF type:complete len:409 (+),score=44.40 TRINITY_DN14245_c0_g1_i1:489-1715(+)
MNSVLRSCNQCRGYGHTYLHCEALSCADCDSFFNRCVVRGRCPALMCSKCQIWGHKVEACITVVCPLCKDVFVDGHDIEECGLRGQENVCAHCSQTGHWNRSCHLLPCKCCGSDYHLTESCRDKSAVKAYRLKLREERARQDLERKAQLQREKEERIAAKNAKKDFWSLVATGSVAQVATLLERTKPKDFDPKSLEAALQMAKENGHLELAFYLSLRLTLAGTKRPKMENLADIQQSVFNLLQSDTGGRNLEPSSSPPPPHPSSSSTLLETQESESQGETIARPKARNVKGKERERDAPKARKPKTIDGTDKVWPAVHSGSIPKILRFLDQGISVDHCNNAGKTLLMIAAEKGHVDLVKLLVERGANLHVANNAGIRAIDLASNPEIRTVLQTESGDPAESSSSGNPL